MSTYTLVYVSKAVGAAAGAEAGREVAAILATARRKTLHAASPARCW